MKVTAGMVARVRALAEPRWSPDGRWLAYLESFDGRGDVMLVPADGGPARRLTADPGAQPTASYGGGVLNWLDAETVVFVAPDGQLHALPIAGGPTKQLTRVSGRVSAPVAMPDGSLVACMVSGKTDQHIVVVDPTGEEWPRRVSRAGDFVFDPSWSPDGSLAWQEWSVPDMAWDASRIWLLTPDGARTAIDGGRDSGDPSQEPVSATQPRFSPDGTQLAYLSDRSGWWNLWLYDPATGLMQQLLQEPVEHGGPTWGPGGMRFAWSPDGRQLALIRTLDGCSGVSIVDLASASLRSLGPQDGSVQAVSWSPLGDRIAVVWGRADQPTCLATLDVVSGEMTIVGHGAAVGFEVSGTPAPDAVTWTSSDGATVHGLLYTPADCADGAGPPPVIVRVHGGPTGHVEAGFDARTSYYLDRGWAVLQVNYRGSSGYGRSYRQALHGTWGVLDVEDTVAGAKQLAARGLVDGDRMVVMGGSAGGYTVLLSLALHPEVFAAGVDLYGVADLFALSEATHRFEAHYLDTIVGPLPETYPRYQERSPVTVASKIARPLLILQGDKDDVVPLAQSEAIYKKLQARGIEVEMKVYEGEGHGWRRLSTVLDELDRVDSFLRRHVLHTAHG